MKRVGLMLTKAQIVRLEKAHKQTGISASELMRQLIDYHLPATVARILDTNLEVQEIESRELSE